MSSNIRVRFAPSPTGPLHIGGVRTALYNYLFAKRNKGKFILRIEDTDQARYVQGAEEYINESLEWCRIKVDEGVRQGGEFGPYRQSERKHIYREYVDQLIDNGNAYWAFDTPEELEKLRLECEKKGETFKYDFSVRKLLKNSLSLPRNEWEKLLENDVPAVVRFMMPEGKEIIMNDIIRGDIHVCSSTLDDKILFKSEGMPTYHLANVVDDHLMKISHVIRGEEWLPSLPLHVMLYRSIGWEEPRFAHLPLLLKPTGKGKLSKRDGEKLGFPVFPLLWTEGGVNRGYREDGYLPEAFINMLALLGWNPGTDKEIFSMDELIESFSLERVGKSGARFDPEKAKWFNHHYIQARTDKEIGVELKKIIEKKGFDPDTVKILELVRMVRQRVSFFDELWDEVRYFFESPVEYDQELVKKKWTGEIPSIMVELKELLHGTEDFSSENVEADVKNWLKDRGYGVGAVLSVLRLLIVGTGRGPHIFDILEWIGKEETLKRIEKGITNL